MAGPTHDVVARFTAITAPLVKGLAKAGVALQAFGAKAQMAAMKFTMAFTAPILLAARAVGKATAQFQQNMTRSTAIMGDLSKAMKDKMADTAKKTARDVNKSSAEMAEGFFFLASAGLNAEQAIAALPAVAQFAVAGAFDLAKATSLAADAQSALGLKVKDAVQNLKNLTRVTDVLVKANTLANATTEQFSRALTTKAGTAIKIVNKEIEEGVAVLAAFADQGIKAENAGTALNIVFRDLKTKGLKFRQEWSKLGGVFDQTTGKMRHMADIIESLEGHVRGLSDEESHAALKTLGFADKSLVFTQALIGMSGKIREFEKNLKKAGGTTDEVAEKQLKNLADRFTMAKQKVNEMMIELGTQLVPVFETVAVFIEDIGVKIGELAGWFERLTEEERKNIIKWVALAAAIGPLLLVLGLLTSAIGFVASAVSALGTALLFLVANPLGALVAIVGITLVTALMSGSKKMKSFGNDSAALGAQLTDLKGKLETAIDAIAKFRASKLRGEEINKELAETASLLHQQKEALGPLQKEFKALEDQLFAAVPGKGEGMLSQSQIDRYKELKGILKEQEPILNELIEIYWQLEAKSKDVATETEGLTLGGLRLHAALTALALGGKEVDKALLSNQREAAALGDTTDECTIALKGMEREEKALKSAMTKIAPYLDIIEVFEHGAKKAMAWMDALVKLREEREDISPAPPAEAAAAAPQTEVKRSFGPDILAATEEAQRALEDLRLDLMTTGEFTELAFNTGAVEIYRAAITGGIEELRGMGLTLEEMQENAAIQNMGVELEVFQARLAATTEQLSESQKAWTDWLEEGQKVAKHLTNAMTSAFDSISSGFGDVVARAVIDGEDFGEMMKQMWNNIAKQIISALVQIGVQWLITAILGKAIDQGTHTTKVGQSTSQAAAAAFAAYAGIPFIGPALGAAAAVAATAGTIAASVAGYAAGTVAGALQMAHGGIVTAPTLAMIGEAGPEAVIPLTGRNALSMKTQHINLYLDGEMITETVLQNMPDEVRLNLGSQI